MILKEKYGFQCLKSRYILLSFCLISSAIAVIPFGWFFYSLGIAGGVIYIFSQPHCSNNNLFSKIIILCYVSSIISGLIDYRILLFTILVFLVTPILNSTKLLLFRVQYIYYSLLIFPLLSLVSLYCYFNGINMMAREEGDVSWDFSALFWHSMWLGAANGISNVVVLWLFFKSTNRIWKFVFAVGFVTSVFISVVSGSRSALAASLIAVLLLVFMRSNTIKEMVKNAILIIAISISAYPFYYEYADRMIEKNEYQKKVGRNSRDAIFRMRMLDFRESPLIGVGFAVGHDLKTKELRVGKMESGSGWISVICQIGMIGFVLLCFIFYRIIRNVRYRVHSDVFLQLLVSILCFLSAHSLFEGYILTAGYYLCIIFWGILGILYSYPKDAVTCDSIKKVCFLK